MNGHLWIDDDHFLVYTGKSSEGTFYLLYHQIRGGIERLVVPLGGSPIQTAKQCIAKQPYRRADDEETGNDAVRNQ